MQTDSLTTNTFEKKKDDKTLMFIDIRTYLTKERLFKLSKYWKLLSKMVSIWFELRSSVFSFGTCWKASVGMSFKRLFERSSSMSWTNL